MAKNDDTIKKLLDPGGMIWNPDAEAAEKRQQKEMDDIARAYGEIDLPDLAEIDPSLYEDVGGYDPSLVESQSIDSPEALDPRLADMATMGNTAYEDVSVDPRLKDTQMGSLEALDDIIQGGGMNAQEQAQLAKVQGDVAQADRGRRDAIKQNMQARGMGGSGMELLAQLDSSQAATDRASQAGLDIEGMAQQRALDAIMQSGQLAGNIRGQDYGEQAQLASAKDAINQFNTANTLQNNQWNAGQVNNMGQFNAGMTQDTNKFNAGQNMTGQLANQGAINTQASQQTANTQAVKNKNTDTVNQAQLYNKSALPQQQFQNQMSKTAGATGTGAAAADYYGQRAQGARTEASEKAGGVMGIVGSIFSDETKKHDKQPVNESEIDEFLNAVKGKKFKYNNPKEPGQSPGQKVGFMLQDVKDTSLGKDLVDETDKGLMYDPQNLDGIMLAALAKLAEEKK